jgi:protein-disulfide isomerase
VHFATTTAREVENEYVATGLVKRVFVDFAIHGEPEVVSAEAAHCAQDQGQFWAYHDLLVDNFDGAYSRQHLERFAKKLNLNMVAFDQCLDSHKYRDFVIASTQQARGMGIKIQPTLLINQRVIEGGIPFKDLQPFIEEELQRVP